MAIPQNELQTLEVVTKGYVSATGTGGHVCLNVFHFSRGGDTYSIQMDDILAKFHQAIVTPWMLTVSTNYSMSGILGRFLNDATDPYRELVGSNTGVLSGDRMPTYGSVCLRLVCDQRGRNYRGSKHIGGIAESDTLQDTLSGQAVTRFYNLAKAIEQGFVDSAGNVWRPVVVSKTLSQLQSNPTTVAQANVVLVTANNVIGTMNRRKYKSPSGVTGLRTSPAVLPA